MFQNYILSQKQNIIGSLCDLITYPSVSEETSNCHFPFGKDCSDCLKYFLSLADSLGFRTKNIDGYCGFAEFGEGKELLGIVGHLDVVPANEADWKYSAFTPTIANGHIYGRGAIDDKGPVIASLYAMKAVMEYAFENNIKLNKRVRLIVGLNEEKNWKCIERYKQTEEIPTIGFSPDSDFPCIYAEKSVISVLLKETLPITTSNNIFSKIKQPSICIEEINCGDNALNVVPKICSVVISVHKPFQISSVISYLKKTIEHYNYEIDIYKIDPSRIKLTSYGVASHSAHPELGINAISKLIVVLQDLLKECKINIPILSEFCEFIGDDYTGNNMHLNIEDESGKLTLNTSQFYLQDNTIHIGINLRVPVHTQPNEIISTFEKTFPNKVHVLRVQDPLFIDKNAPIVQTLCKVFNECCNSNLEPIAIGGATYARAFPNCVCFGMNFPGDKDMCHQADEFVDINKLLFACNIYAKAIYELST